MLWWWWWAAAAAAASTYLLYFGFVSHPAVLDLNGLVHLPGRDNDAVEFFRYPLHGRVGRRG